MVSRVIRTEMFAAANARPEAVRRVYNAASQSSKKPKPMNNSDLNIIGGRFLGLFVFNHYLYLVMLNQVSEDSLLTDVPVCDT